MHAQKCEPQDRQTDPFALTATKRGNVFLHPGHREPLVLNAKISRRVVGGGLLDLACAQETEDLRRSRI